MKRENFSFNKMRAVNIFKNVFILIFIILLSTACALGVDRVKLYDPLMQKPDKDEVGVAYANVPIVTPISGEKIKIIIKKVRDSRPSISYIGAKSNTYGQHTGIVDVEEGVVFLDLFRKHLINTFELAGYKIVSIKSSEANSAINQENIKAFVEVDIRTFWVEFVPGFFTVDALSNVVLEVTLKEPNTGREILDEVFKGQGKVSSGFAITREHFEESINLAYAEAMRKLYGIISDPKTRAILRK